MAFEFRWMSLLGAGVALFIIVGLFWILIGVLTVLLLGKKIGPTMIFISNRTDRAYFGGDPDELLESNQPLVLLRKLLVEIMAGFLTLSGLIFVQVAWYGLRTGQLWALTALGLGGMAAVGFWIFALSSYPRSGVALALTDIPPFIWLPGILILPAIILSWLGLR